MFRVPEEHRITEAKAKEMNKLFPIHPINLANWITDASFQANGFFFVPHKQEKKSFFLCLATCEMGWEHVSVSIPTKDRVPTWSEMCYIKSLFWEAEDTVVQFHPPESEYVNNHEFCLHLWREVDKEYKSPPSILVGIKK